MADDKRFEREVTEEGRFPKEPDEGDEAVIDHELARQRQQQQGGSGTRSSEGGTDPQLKQATIDSTKGLP